MKTAQTPDGEPLVASQAASAQAVCPFCGGTVSLRSRKVMNSTEKTYFWRHKGNHNRNCSGRKRPFG